MLYGMPHDNYCYTRFCMNGGSSCKLMVISIHMYFYTFLSFIFVYTFLKLIFQILFIICRSSIRHNYLKNLCLIDIEKLHLLNKMLLKKFKYMSWRNIDDMPTFMNKLIVDELSMTKLNWQRHMRIYNWCWITNLDVYMIRSRSLFFLEAVIYFSYIVMVVY